MPAPRLRVLGIQNYGPSGSTLVHSLLDGHPEVLSLPGLYPIGFYTRWRTLFGGARRRPTRSLVVECLMTWLQPLCDRSQLEAAWGLTELGDGRDADCCVDASA